MAKQLYYHALPARILHWVNAANIGLLTTTGLYIRDPGHFAVFATMDIARKTHFIAMYLVIYGVIIRIYYSYKSRDYRELLFRVREIKEFPTLFKYYLFIRRDLPDYGKYNPAQKLTYNAWAVLIFLQAVSGFILYWPDKLARPAMIFGGLLAVRQFHFMLTWVFIITVSLHVYLSLLGGWTVIKSMITGYFPEGEHMQPDSEEAGAN